MNDIALPLKIRRGGGDEHGSYYIEDSNNQSICYVYYSQESLVKSQHFGKDAARETAKMIARLVTDKLEGW